MANDCHSDSLDYDIQILYEFSRDLDNVLNGYVEGQFFCFICFLFIFLYAIFIFYNFCLDEIKSLELIIKEKNLPVLDQPKKKFPLCPENISFDCPESSTNNRNCSHCSTIWKRFNESATEFSDTDRQKQSSITKLSENVKW